MKPLLYIVTFFLLVSCSVTVPLIEEPALPVVTFDGDVLCIHKHDPDRNFAYTPPVKEYRQVIMGETIFTYEFVLTSGEKHFLSGSEQINYQCNPVN